MCTLPIRPTIVIKIKLQICFKAIGLPGGTQRWNPLLPVQEHELFPGPQGRSHMPWKRNNPWPMLSESRETANTEACTLEPVVLREATTRRILPQSESSSHSLQAEKHAQPQDPAQPINQYIYIFSKNAPFERLNSSDGGKSKSVTASSPKISLGQDLPG